MFSIYTRDLSVELANILVGYADDSTLVAHVPHPSVRVAVVGTLNRDLESIADWCDRWGMEVNPSKTKALVISRSRTKYPEFPGLYLNGAPVEVVRELKLLGIILDRKLTFEAQIRSIVASTSSKLAFFVKLLVSIVMWKLLPAASGLSCYPYWNIVQLTGLARLPVIYLCWIGLCVGLLYWVRMKLSVIFYTGGRLHLCVCSTRSLTMLVTRWDCIIQISWSLVGLHGEQLWCTIMFWWLLGVELSSIRGLLSQLVLLFGITLMALFLMVWIWVASSLRLIVLFLVDCCVLFSFNFFLFIFEWLTAWRFC